MPDVNGTVASQSRPTEQAKTITVSVNHDAKVESDELFKVVLGVISGLGVGIDPHSGIPKHDPETMETNVPDLFIAGVIAAGHNANKIFIENGREHGGRIVQALAGRLKRPAGRGA